MNCRGRKKLDENQSNSSSSSSSRKLGLIAETQIVANLCLHVTLIPVFLILYLAVMVLPPLPLALTFPEPIPKAVALLTNLKSVYIVTWVLDPFSVIVPIISITPLLPHPLTLTQCMIGTLVGPEEGGDLALGDVVTLLGVQGDILTDPLLLRDAVLLLLTLGNPWKQTTWGYVSFFCHK